MTELQIQKQIVAYIRTVYPDVLFRANVRDASKTSPAAGRQLKLAGASRGWPDLFIAEPRAHYHGLFIELKKDQNSLYTKTGEYRKNKHLAEQIEIIEQLKQRGYRAEFSVGLEHTINIIDEYLGEK